MRTNKKQKEIFFQKRPSQTPIFTVLSGSYTSPSLQNVLIINSWLHGMKGGKEFRALGIKEAGERVADVTRIIT